MFSATSWWSGTDVSGPLNTSGSLSGRLIYANEDRDSYLDYYGVNRNVYGALLAWEATPKATATFGYSMQDNDNTEAQSPNAFHTGHYALGNVLYYPAPNVTVGGELQWGRRENFSDGFESDGFKLQFSFKYNFSWKLGG